MTTKIAMTSLRRKSILQQASGYVELGELLVEADKPTPLAAQKLLLRALELLNQLPEPTRSKPTAKLLEGEALRSLGRWQPAIDSLWLVVQEAPHQTQAWLGMGWCLKRLGRLNEAIAILEQGLVASPKQPILHYNLACYCSLGGSVQTAIDHLTQAIAVDVRFRDLTAVERDFDPIRTDPRFVQATHLTA